ncbi:RNA polymerase sigma factor SigJ [Luteolibacter sp. Populi]|uniref:RNA polymerase sigma factor SigJ n=1 Tax=Luteolibacter sp. Populi TaxID=3230487 RepID=UPI003467A7BE
MESAAVFEEHRPFLRSLAYRMLGILADAEDIVQEAWLRWVAVPAAEIDAPRSYLAKTVTRLCLDHLKSARVRRETYVGPWLPEPVADEPGESHGDDVSYAMLHAMERLTPLERAAFLLHDVFGESFEEIGDFLSRPAATCRQLASRARRHLRAEAPRHPVDPGEGRRLANAFLQAARGGDLAALKRLLLNDAVLVSDGGGVVRAALRPILGNDKIARMFESLIRRNPPDEVREVRYNGLDGLLYLTAGRATDLLLFEPRDGGIGKVFAMRNPGKMERIR